MEISNFTRFKIDRELFTGVAKKVLKGENREREKISLALAGKEEIKKLNKKFRNKNKPTDVLSFCLKEKDLLGEVVICPQVVKEKKEDIRQVFIHGILHLLGYDHEKSEKEAIKMEKLEEKYFDER